MNKKLWASLVIGIIIILVPVFLTGDWYNPGKIVNTTIIAAEFLGRTIAWIIGLLVIYHGITRSK
ncbi:hypothetical protein [Paenibacillus massiliensis]|uniref:hypothetical protein n=1 Tax=Paenibacillus massiliensis TaxID=225917 RepID=UPI00048DDD2B|nr:hypothetical protein [Paenibacillus massiliensis]